MNTINKHISTKNFCHLYLLYGKERYLVKQFKDKLQKALLGDGDLMNLLVRSDKEINWQEVMDFANTLPFFGERRVIILENSPFFSTGNEAIVNYLKDVPEDAYFVFVEGDEVKKSKLLNLIYKTGYVCEMKNPSVKIIYTWTKQILGDNGFKIEEDAFRLLINYAGTDLNILDKEFEKLMSYCGERKTITCEDVEAITVKTINSKVYQITQAMTNKNQKLALSIYQDMLLEKIEPMIIMYNIQSTFNNILLIKMLKEEHKSMNEMPSIIGANPYALEKLSVFCKDYTKSELREILDSCAESEFRYKRGLLNGKLAVELLITKYSN